MQEMYTEPQSRWGTGELSTPVIAAGVAATLIIATAAVVGYFLYERRPQPWHQRLFRQRGGRYSLGRLWE